MASNLEATSFFDGKTCEGMIIAMNGLEESKLNAASCEDAIAEELETIRWNARQLSSQPKKVVLTEDYRGIPELKLRFPQVPVEVLTALMNQYQRYTAVVDVLLALNGRYQQGDRPLTASFWDRQNWPRPGQLPSLLSWSVVDSADSYDLVSGRVAEDEEDWLDVPHDEDEFAEMMDKLKESEPAPTMAASHHSEAASNIEQAPKLAYNKALVNGSARTHTIRTAPRIPPLIHLRQHKMATICEDEEYNSDDDNGYECIEDAAYRERTVAKASTSYGRKLDRLRIKPATAAKRAQRIADKAAAASLAVTSNGK